MRNLILILGAIVLYAPVARADQVTLINGDRLTGEIVNVEGGRLLLRSEHFGDVGVKLESVLEARSDAPVTLTLKDQRVLAGRLEVAAQEWRIETASGRTGFDTAEIAALRSESEQKAFLEQQQKARRAGLLDLWFGNFELGLSAARGNGETTTLTTGLNASRVSEKDRVQLYFTSLFARNRDDAGVLVTSANAIRGGGQYDRNITRKVFFFGFADYAVDRLQDLDLRSVYGGGAGFQFFRSPRFSLEAFGGGSYNRESFATGENRNSGEALAGQDLSWRLGSKLRLTERFVFYPNLTETGEYRINFDTSLNGQLNRWLGWHLTISDRFLSNPLPGTRRNDLLITTGVRFTFGEEREFKAVTGRGARR